MADRMVIQTVVSQLFGENAYIIHASGESACAVIDPGFDVARSRIAWYRMVWS